MTETKTETDGARDRARDGDRRDRDGDRDIQTLMYIFMTGIQLYIFFY